MQDQPRRYDEYSDRAGAKRQHRQGRLRIHGESVGRLGQGEAHEHEPQHGGGPDRGGPPHWNGFSAFHRSHSRKFTRTNRAFLISRIFTDKRGLAPRAAENNSQPGGAALAALPLARKVNAGSATQRAPRDLADLLAIGRAAIIFATRLLRVAQEIGAARAHKVNFGESCQINRRGRARTDRAPVSARMSVACRES